MDNTPTGLIGWFKVGLGGTGKHPDNGDWESHRRLILHELHCLRERDDKILDKLESMSRSLVAARMDISSLKAKAGIFGVIGGLIPVLIALALMLIKGETL